MISFKVEDWQVICATPNDPIVLILKEMDCGQISEILENLRTDCGFTYSKNKTTLIVINEHLSISELIDTIEHEKNHLEMHICEYYDINPFSEQASYLSGYIAKQMFKSFINKYI